MLDFDYVRHGDDDECGCDEFFVVHSFLGTPGNSPV